MLGTKFHYGNCKQDYADLNHQFEKQKTKISNLEQTARESEQIILELTNEINELKAIHHYERDQLEKKVQVCDETHANLAQELQDLQDTYKDCLEDKRAATAELLQLKHDLKHEHHNGVQINVIDDKTEVISKPDTEQVSHAKKTKSKRK